MIWQTFAILVAASGEAAAVGRVTPTSTPRRGLGRPVPNLWTAPVSSPARQRGGRDGSPTPIGGVLLVRSGQPRVRSESRISVRRMTSSDGDSGSGSSPVLRIDISLFIGTTTMK